MAHLSGIDRSQMLLLPEAVEEYVGPDNAVCFIEAFVDGLRPQPLPTGGKTRAPLGRGNGEKSRSADLDA